MMKNENEIVAIRATEFWIMIGDMTVDEDVMCNILPSLVEIIFSV